MLWPVPMMAGAPEGYWEIVNQRGYSVAHGFKTKHHAWRWIIGPSYNWPRKKLGKRRRSPKHYASLRR